MAKITLHGLIGRLFGNSFNINVNSAMSVLKALDANREGFFKKMYDLNNQGYDYYIIINGEQVNNENQFIEKKIINTVDIIPAIYGSGTAIVTSLASAAFAETLTGVIIATIINVAISSAISLGVSLIMSALQKQSAGPQQSYMSIGGAAAAVEAKGKSYIFSNYQNAVNQGSPLPVGYGRTKIASNVIHSSIKDYPTNYKFEDETNINQSQSIFSNYLAF
jgi:predicted phage tail protein